MDELTLYFDRNFGKRLPNALSKLRPPVDIRWHQGEGFAPNMPDDEWMESVGARGWVVLTHDIKFHLIDHEIEALKQHEIKCFYFPDAQVGMWQTLGLFMRTHGRIISISKETNAPFIYKVLRNGSIKPVFPSASS